MDGESKPDQLYREARETFAELGKFNPEAMKGFVDCVHEVEKDGALSSKIKQIIMVSVSIAKKCAWCITYHTRKAMEYGATREELLEACWTTSLMDGGTAMMYSKLVIAEIENYETKIRPNAE